MTTTQHPQITIPDDAWEDVSNEGNGTRLFTTISINDTYMNVEAIEVEERNWGDDTVWWPVNLSDGERFEAMLAIDSCHYNTHAINGRTYVLNCLPSEAAI